MKFLPALLVLAAIAAADEPRRTDCKCRHREVGESGSRIDWAPYTTGIRWHQSVDEARAMAAEERKLVFYFHIAGDLDKEGC